MIGRDRPRQQGDLRASFHRRSLHGASPQGPRRRRARSARVRWGPSTRTSGSSGCAVPPGGCRTPGPPDRRTPPTSRYAVRGRARGYVGLRLRGGSDHGRRRPGRLAGGGHGQAVRAGDQGRRVRRARRAGRRAGARRPDVGVVVRDRPVLGAGRGEVGAARGVEQPAAGRERRRPRGRLAAHRPREQVLRRYGRDRDDPAAGAAASAADGGVGRRVERRVRLDAHPRAAGRARLGVPDRDRLGLGRRAGTDPGAARREDAGAQRGAGPVRPGDRPVQPVADHPRVHRPRHRAGPRPRLRGRVRRHLLRHLRPAGRS